MPQNHVLHRYNSMVLNRLSIICSHSSRKGMYTRSFSQPSKSVVAGGVAPFMIHVIGQVFDAFARFPLTDATSQDKSVLRHDVDIAVIELVALAAGAIALESVTSTLRIATGEQNVVRLRKKLYEAVTTREMEWFDTKMVAEDSVITIEGNGLVSAGGLMAEFAKYVRVECSYMLVL